MQLRVVSSQARLNVIPIWGHDCAVLCNGEYEQASRTINVKGCVVWPKWMTVWMGNEVECETAQHALFLNPKGGVGWPSRELSSNVLFNRGTEIHPQHGLWVMQLFLLKRGKPNRQKKKVMMSAITGNAMIELGHEGMFLGLKCGEFRGQNVEYFTAQLPCSYSCTWHLSTNGKKCYGKPAISTSALAVVQRRHHQDLPFGLRYTATSSLHVYQPCYCAVQNLFFSLTSVLRWYNTAISSYCWLC